MKILNPNAPQRENTRQTKPSREIMERAGFLVDNWNILVGVFLSSQKEKEAVLNLGTVCFY